MTDPKTIMELAVKTADSKKAMDIKALKVTANTTLADYFVMMTGVTSTHIKSLSEEIEKKLKDELNVVPHHIEGISSSWILLDFTTVVINVFLKETRELYDLERLWRDSESVDLTKIITED